jgi:hypothetical protein
LPPALTDLRWIRFAPVAVASLVQARQRLEVDMPECSRILGGGGTLAGLLVLLGCGGDAGPTAPSSDVDAQGFPIVHTSCFSLSDGSGGPASARYFVGGLSSRVTDPSAPPPLEARLRVGETIELQLNFGPPPGSSSACGSSNSEQWISTQPQIAGVERDARYSFVARVTARAPGAFSVFVDFRGADDQRHRTTLAYCEGSEFACLDPRKIGVVTVVP